MASKIGINPVSVALIHCVLIFAVASNIALPAPSAAAPKSNSVGAFCRMHPELDFPDPIFYGPKRERHVPKEVAAVKATNWRCMEGKVYVCAGGTSGSACEKMDPSRRPSREIRQTCEDNPGQSFVAIAVIGNSSSTRQCLGRSAKTIKTVPIDARGFMKGTWVPLFDARGKINTDVEFGADPR
jgi:hypothetical protein